MLSRQVLASIAQLIASLSHDGRYILIYKHFGVNISSYGSSQKSLLEFFGSQDWDAIMSLLKELVTRRSAIRVQASPRHVFDDWWEDLRKWLLYDGWTVEENELVRIAPAAEEATGTREKLLEDLAVSGLDTDKAIAGFVKDAAASFTAEPPDFNDSVTKVRLAFETLARRAAKAVSDLGPGDYTADSWGRALLYLRQHNVIEQAEEEVLARIYTFISPSAHVPKGMSDEEWARLARTFGLGGTYFLLQKYRATI